MASEPIEIGALARANIRAARARLNLTQASVARRMNQLGYHWYPQTAGLVERNARPLDVAEVAALALCLEVTPDVLYLPPQNVAEVAFGDQVVPAQRFSVVDDSVTWDGDNLKVTAPSLRYRALELRIAREPDPRIRAGIEALTDELRREARGEPQDE
jgi:transcriptional regulator with XRE-family HTH domain